MSKKLYTGWAEESLVPDKKVSLAGQFYERISEYTETPVTVTALAVESAGEQMVLCSCDLVSISGNLTERVREKLKGKAQGLDTHKIILAATHTHTSLKYEKAATTSGSTVDLFKEFLPEGKVYKEKNATTNNIISEKEALEFISDKISLAVEKAWNNKVESYYSNEFARAPVGHCRRVVYDDGIAKMWGDTNSANFDSLEGGNDSGIELMYLFDGGKEPTGVVVNIACPSQVVEQRSFISSDYWGKVKILLREKFGEDFFVLGLCGAAGDQCPRDMIRWVNPESPIDDPNIERDEYILRKADPSMFDIKGTWTIGKRISNEIIDVYEQAVKNMTSEPVFFHKKLIIDLPIRKVTMTEYEKARKVIEEYIRQQDKDCFDYNDSARMHVWGGTILRYEYQRKNYFYSPEIHIIRFGDMAFATNPFELFLDYGNRIKARSKAVQTFIIQLACETYGYLPTEKAEKGGHYSAYISSGIAGSEAGKILVDKTLDEINSLFN